jgi:hypothetical protein
MNGMIKKRQFSSLELYIIHGILNKEKGRKLELFIMYK